MPRGQRGMGRVRSAGTPGVIPEQEISQFQRMLEPLPTDPRTWLDYTKIAQWHELESQRAFPRESGCAETGEIYRRWADLAYEHGPGRPETLRRRAAKARRLQRMREMS
jgi:hypothetical protein